MSSREILRRVISDLELLNARIDAGLAFREGRLNESEFRATLSDLGISGLEADLEVIYNDPSNKEWLGP